MVPNVAGYFLPTFVRSSFCPPATRTINMSRKRKSSTAEDLMDIVAMLPWWAGVALAGACYWALHAVATRAVPALQSTQQIGDAAFGLIFQSLSTIGQFVLPGLCLAGALISAMRKRQRAELINTASASAEALQGISWQKFEILVGEGFRRRGYSVKETGGGGPDGGIDLVLVKDGENFLVQCKQWKAFKVGVSTVRELYGVMAATGAAGGFVVTSGRFTPEATAFANGRNIQLIDGPILMQMLRDTHPETVGSTDPAVTPPVASLETDRSGCPSCGKPMVRRVARRGSAAGKTFMGCSAFAEGCRGVRSIRTD